MYVFIYARVIDYLKDTIYDIINYEGLNEGWHPEELGL
jgi:hypothetical protein